MDIQFWQTTGWGIFNLIKQMVVIIIPIMICMEILKDLKILDRLTTKLHWTVKPFGLPQAAVFPLLVGLVLGLSYGAGFIIQAAKDGALTKRDLYLVSLFLVINHSMFEDTLLFAALGANAWLLITFRFVTSVIITLVVSKFVLPVPAKPVAQTLEN